MMRRGMPMADPCMNFQADHPFLYYIWNRNTEILYFAGSLDELH